MCQRLKNTDLCLAQAIHQSLIHCQHSSSTVVLEMGRPIVRADESGGQKLLHTPQRTLDTKRGASLFKQLLKSKHFFCGGAKRHGHSLRCWLRSFSPEAHKPTHKNSRAERSQSHAAHTTLIPYRLPKAHPVHKATGLFFSPPCSQSCLTCELRCG